MEIIKFKQNKMQRLIIILIISLLGLYSQAQEADYIFKNVNIITMNDDKIIEKQTVVIKDGKIIEITGKTNYKSENIIDGKGKFLMPTMADAHVHFPESYEELEKVMKLNLINGLTNFQIGRASCRERV